MKITFFMLIIATFIGCSSTIKRSPQSTPENGSNPYVGEYYCVTKTDIEPIRSAITFDGETLAGAGDSGRVSLELHANSRYSFGVIVTEIEEDGRMIKVPSVARLKDGENDVVLQVNGRSRTVIINGEGTRNEPSEYEGASVIKDEILMASVQCKKR